MNNVVEVVNKILQNTATIIELERLRTNSKTERFIKGSALRLVKIYDLYRENKNYYCDLLVSLRNYLLFNSSYVDMFDISIEKFDEYGLVIRGGKIYAIQKTPEYLNKNFVDDVFKLKYIKCNDNDKYNLITDPFIYNLTGYTKFKSLAQKIAVYSALNTPNGYTTILSLPTGGGKSLVTQALAYKDKGLSVVVVPTVSLAIDQVRAARSIIKSDYAEHEIMYYASGVDFSSIKESIDNHVARLLFISPEALINNPGFERVLSNANDSRYLKNFIIDEAHIVFDWGTSFRVDYQYLDCWRRKKLKNNTNLKTFLLSATFEEKCVNVLKQMFETDNKWIEVRCDALRHEPKYNLVLCSNMCEKNHRIIELVKKLPHPIIVYTIKPDDAINIKNMLNDEGMFNVKTFTGNTSGIERKKLIDDWIDNQYEIMIATSAFGVGVDKNDVRTVVHTYIPENPNEYYQELGRGGRDGISSLSVMCINKKIDKDCSFGRLSKRVMTKEIIIERWFTMFNAVTTKIKGDRAYIDVSVKPKRLIDDPLDDMPISDVSLAWNIYVLLFLRRNLLLNIEEIINKNDKKFFLIKNINPLLFRNNDELLSLISNCREEESNYYSRNFREILYYIENYENECWSEMFFNTYGYSDEYCPGCGVHNKEFSREEGIVLKKVIQGPLNPVTVNQNNIFNELDEMLIFGSFGKNTFKFLLELNIKIILDFSCKINENLLKISDKNVFIMNKEIMENIGKKNKFFISGVIAIVYSDDDAKAENEYNFVLKTLVGDNVKLIHIFKEDFYYQKKMKYISEVINAGILDQSMI